MIKIGTFVLPNLAALYSQPYSGSMERWRQIGAIDKSAHILQMVRGRESEIKTVLEVGCGTGAVLQQLAKAQLGCELVGVEIGAERSKNRLPQPTSLAIEIKGFDGNVIPYPNGHFDLVYATHVLEHVLNERSFLEEMRRVSRNLVFVEVPCELHLRTSLSSLQTTLNIGHINAYTLEAFALTLETSGLSVKKIELFDHSFGVHAFHSTKPTALAKMLIRRAFLGVSHRLASRLFTYHCAALCERGPLLQL